MKFSELQDQLRENFGINHLADIAREFGVSPQAVSNWKSRNQVPYKYVIRIREKLKESDDHISNQDKNIVAHFNQASIGNANPQHFEGYSTSPVDTLLTLAKQVRIIIITPIIFCISALIYVIFIAQPVYQSNAKIMSSSGIVKSVASGLVAEFGIKMPGGQSDPKWVYPDIIKSRTLARAMLQRKFDTQKYGPQKQLLQILTYGKYKPTVELDILTKAGIVTVHNMIDIQKNGNFYELTVSASEPLFARDFLTAVLEELDSHQREYNKTKASESKAFIEERIIDTEKELQAAEEALKNFRDRNRRIENSPALLLEQQRLSREVAVLIGVFTTLKQNLETTKIEEVKDSDYVVILDKPESPIERSSPRKKFIVIFAGVFGLGLGTLLGVFKEYYENSDNEERDKINQAWSLIIKNVYGFLPYRFRKI